MAASIALSRDERLARGRIQYAATHPTPTRPCRRASEDREVDDCPAIRHRHNRDGWYNDGCRCPSTRKAWEAYTAAQRDYRLRRSGTYRPRINLALATRRDAQAIAQGYHLNRRVDHHTQALAVVMMLRANPMITDRQISWRLTSAGQGRTVSRLGGPPRYEPVSMRHVQRLLSALVRKPSCADIAALDRCTRHE